MYRPILMLLAAAVLGGSSLLVSASTATAQTPVAEGDIYSPANGRKFGQFYVYETTSNEFGFWVRVYYTDGRSTLLTVVPSAITDTELTLWYHEYRWFGSDPEDTRFWTKVGTGEIVLDLTTADSTSVEGQMRMLTEFIGDTPHQVPYPTWHALGVEVTEIAGP